MSTALIGFTGFVGSMLMRRAAFDHHYNSKNIHEIAGQKFNLVICAGAPAVKWQANQNPADDLANIQRLIDSLRNISTKTFILISTVDVYEPPYNIDEDTVIVPDKIHPYGKHRFLLEQFVRQHFPQHHVIRLPGLFGAGLKKNFIYDLMHTNCLHLTHRDSRFQFYNLENLWEHIQLVQYSSQQVINLATQPVSAREVANFCFGIDFQTETERPPIQYDMHTKYASLFGKENPYINSAGETLVAIRKFVRQAHYVTR